MATYNSHNEEYSSKFSRFGAGRCMLVQPVHAARDGHGGWVIRLQTRSQQNRKKLCGTVDSR